MLWYSCGLSDPELGAPESSCIVRALPHVSSTSLRNKTVFRPKALRQYKYKGSSSGREAESATAGKERVVRGEKHGEV